MLENSDSSPIANVFGKSRPMAVGAFDSAMPAWINSMAKSGGVPL